VSQKKVSKKRVSKKETSEDQRLFASVAETAVANGDAVPWAHGKVLIVGEGAAGKTSCVRSICKLPHIKEHISTLGGELTDVAVTDTQNFDVVEDAKDLQLAMHRLAARRIDDMSAPPAPPTLRLSVPRQTESAPTKRKSISSRIASKVPALIPRKKSIAKQQLVEEETAMEFDEKLILKEKDNVSLIISFWDFGGQRVFYSLHHIFLTRYGIYLVVFDMRKILSKDQQVSKSAKEYLEFWLKSIKAHASNAKVILVGTHHDIIQSNKDLDSIDDALSEELSIEDYGDSLVLNEAFGRFFSPLNNASSDLNRASALRMAIESTMRDEKYIKETVSLRWI